MSYEVEYKVYLKPEVINLIEEKKYPMQNIVQCTAKGLVGGLETTTRVRQVTWGDLRNPTIKYYLTNKIKIANNPKVIENETEVSKSVFDNCVASLVNPTWITKNRWTMVTNSPTPFDVLWTIDMFQNSHFVAECEGEMAWNITDGRIVMAPIPTELVPYVGLIAPPGSSLLAQGVFMSEPMTKLLDKVYRNS